MTRDKITPSQFDFEAKGISAPHAGDSLFAFGGDMQINPINPKHLYAANRKLFAPDFDPDAGEDSGSIMQDDRPKPIALPAGSPPLTNTVQAEALPDVQRARPALVSRVTARLDSPSPSRLDRVLADEGISDYRGRKIEDPVAFRRDQFVRAGGTTDAAGNLKRKRSAKDIIFNIMDVLSQGAKANPDRPLATLAGAAGAGIGSALNPIAGRELRFDLSERPRLEAELERERKSRAQRISEQMQLDKARRQAEIDGEQVNLIRERIKALSAPKQQTRRPSPQLKLGRNRQTDEVRYYDALDPEQADRYEPYQSPRSERPRAERRPSTSEQMRRIDAEETAREGTPEQIALDSTNARKADVIASAPESTRAILQNGKRADGKTATQREIAQAQTWFNREMNRIYQENLRHTRGVRARNKAERVTGAQPLARPSTSPSSTLKRNVNDLPPLR